MMYKGWRNTSIKVMLESDRFGPLFQPLPSQELKLKRVNHKEIKQEMGEKEKKAKGFGFEEPLLCLSLLVVLVLNLVLAVFEPV